jgi:transcriptional regulator with XRE-family HTH domain
VDKGLSLTELATKAHVSKGYLSNLENDPDHKRPSAQTLYAIAKALGVTMSDLLGEKLIVEPIVKVPAGLRAFADEVDLPHADVQMLASIQFRGGQPQSKERWRHIYDAIRMSQELDRR